MASNDRENMNAAEGITASKMTLKTLLNVFSDDQLYVVLDNVCGEIERDLSRDQTVNLLRTLREIVRVIDEKHPAPQPRLLSALNRIVDDVCTPILLSEHAGTNRELCEVAIATKWFCLELTGEENVVEWARECEKSVQIQFDREPPEKCSKPKVALEIVTFLFGKMKKNVEFNEFAVQFQSTLSWVLSRCDSQFAAFVLVDVVPPLLKLMDLASKLELVEILWERAQSFFSFTYSDCQSKSVGNGYLIVCNLMELMTEEAVFSSFLDRISSEKNLWLLIRFGLAHENSLHRKQALFVLKHVTSRAKLESQHFSWSNYILIIETLEETQVHVIKPVLGKIDRVIKASDISPFHLELLSTLFHRMFLHDSKLIKKWALERFLRLNFTKENFIDAQFVFGPLLNVINDASLFARSQNEQRGSVPAIVSSFSRFFTHCVVILRGSSLIVDFFSSLLGSIRGLNWAPVPLLYISYSLSTVPVAPAWNLTALEDLKSLIVDCLRTQEKYLRIAVHCFFLDAFLKLVKKDDVTFDILSSFLLPFAQNGVLSRRTELRSRCVEWLRQLPSAANLTSSDVGKFIKRTMHRLNETENNHTNTDKDDFYLTDLEMERTSRTLVLSLDAGLLALSSVGMALGPVKMILSSVNTRPYLPLAKVDRSLKFVVSLLEEVEISRTAESSQDAVRMEVVACIAPCLTSIIDYALIRISNHMDDVKRLEMYLKLLKSLFKAYEDSNEMDECVNKLTDLAALHFDDANSEDHLLSKYCAVACLAWIVEIIESEMRHLGKWKLSGDKILRFVRHKFTNNLFKYTLTKSSSNNNCDVYLGQRGRIVSEYYNCVWKCLAFHASRCHNELEVVALIEFALYTLEIGTDVIPPVCRCIQHVLSLSLSRVFDENEQLFGKLLHSVWNMAFERRKTEIFWIAIEAFLQVAFHPRLLDHPNASNSILIHFCEKAHELSDTCPTIFHMLVFHCVDVWMRSKDTRRNMSVHAQLMANALTFGPVHRKDQRVKGDADAFVSALGETCTVNSLFESDHLDEVSVRAAAVSLIVSLESGHPLVAELIALLLAQDAAVGATATRYYANSLIHLKKNRVWQTILVLEPLCAQEALTGVLKNVYGQLVEEGSQLSIRVMQEWLAVRILLRFATLRDELWDEIEKAAGIRVGSIGSFLGIIYHVGKLLEPLQQQEEFVLAAFRCVLPWCMAQNFNTRVTAQVVFHKLWLICESNDLKNALDMYGPVESSLTFSYRGGNSARCTQKIFDNYYFKAFDARKHYSLQTIFHDILRLTDVSDYEWIPAHVFTKFRSEENSFIRTFSGDEELSAFQTEENVQVEVEVEENVENGNVQKKMTPCKRASNGELIVVASLIDRIPNLGGLCRSCEIFGAKEYVVANMKCIQDKQFQNLSVSAEKWVAMCEVKPFQLKEYLTSKRNQGYVLIGAEQTADSVRVDEYKFPEKCLLLLGNEKEGIPVSLIQMLDACVQIPQRGVVRSLNVHVCGALLVWEYSRQNEIVSYIISTDVRFSNTKINSVVFIKRGSVVEADKSVASQVRVLNLSDAVAPYFKSIVNESGKADRHGDKMAPSVEKTMAELEMGLLHLQQNIDIPEISLNVHPRVAQIMKKCMDENVRPKVSDFGDRVEDSTFLNQLQNQVNRWIREIQKVTKLDRDPSSGTALQEVSFWLNLDWNERFCAFKRRGRVWKWHLPSIYSNMEQRFHATVSFDTDTGLKHALATVNDYNPLMKDFLINDLLSAIELDRIRSN